MISDISWELEFDKKVKDSKAEAEEALKKIPQIEQNIDDAEQKTQEAYDNLAGAEKNANAAKDIAEMAQDVAEQTSEVCPYKLVGWEATGIQFF